MSLTLTLAVIVSFFLAYAATHYTLTSWQVKAPVSIVIAAILGAFFALFATIATDALVKVVF